MFTIEITPSFDWTLRTPFGMLQRDSHSILSSTPKHLCTVENVLQVIDLFRVNKVCSGIDDAKFQPVIAKHKGVFMDRTGKCLCSTQCTVVCFSLTLNVFVSTREKIGGTVRQLLLNLET